MKRLTVCGNGGLLKYVLDKLYTDKCIEVACVVESMEVISSDTISDGVVLAVSWHDVEKWIEQLKACNVQEIYRVPVFAMQYGLEIVADGEFILDHVSKVALQDSNLLYVETHVADTCNLKCKGCMHFSNIATEANFPELETFEKDFKRLSELFDNIFIIRLMGGEPLLNPDLGKYISVVRKFFPAAELRVVSNGLLVPGQLETIWQTMREHHVAMDISPYPPTIRNLDKILGVLNREGIPYGKVSEQLSEFRKSLMLTPINDPVKSTKICQSSHCHFLRNGMISKCPLPLLIDDFNNAYGCDIKSDAIYNIYEEWTGAELREMLEGYIDMCKYCPDREAFIPWQRTNGDARKEDWVVEETE